VLTVAVRFEDERLDARSGSTWTCERKPTTFAPAEILHRGAELLPHRVLEGRARRLDGVEAAGLDQRTFDGRVDLLEEADDVVGAHHRPRSLCAASVVLTVESDDGVRDRGSELAPRPILTPILFHERLFSPLLEVAPGGKEERSSDRAGGRTNTP
jgi:hypothetical protein